MRQAVNFVAGLIIALLVLCATVALTNYAGGSHEGEYDRDQGALIAERILASHPRTDLKENREDAAADSPLSRVRFCPDAALFI